MPRFMFRSFIAVAAAALAACGGGEAPAPAAEGSTGGVIERSAADIRAADQRERRRQQAAKENQADFSYLRYRIDVSSETPKACFIFSAALDPEVDYDAFVDFRPAFRPALAVDGDELCVGGLAFGTERTAILLAGLPAADGRALASTQETPVEFQNRPPYVGFKGSGVVLPRIEADGLAIETVNVDGVRIDVSRVNDRALFEKRVTAGSESAEGVYSRLYGDDDPRSVSSPVWSGEMDVDNVQNAAVVTVFPLNDVIGELEPGAYFVEIVDNRELSSREGPPASARRWIITTDLALTAYEGGHGLDVTLRSLQTGQPVAGARVQLVARNNEVLAESQTGSDGRVAFGAPLTSGERNLEPRLVLAFGGQRGDFAMLDLDRAPVDLSSDATGGRPPPGEVDAYLYSERGIYRPGETVRLTALMRGRRGRALSGRAGTLVVYRPNGLEAERVRFAELRGGGFQTDYDLSRGAARGVWRAAVEIDGLGEVGSVRFSVEDFVPQRIEVELDAASDAPILAGETRDATVDARFLYGAPGAGLVVQPQVRIEADPSPFERFEGFQFGRHDAPFTGELVTLPEQTADGAGRALIRLDPAGRGAEAQTPLRVNAVVSVLEPGGRAVTDSVRIPYRPRDAYLGVRKAASPGSDEGGAHVFETALIDSATGRSVAARLAWKILAIDYHYDWYRDGGGQWRWRRSRSVTVKKEGVLATPEGGVDVISADDLDWGDHELTVEGPDGQEASYAFWVGWGGRVRDDGVEAPDRVSVAAPEGPVAVGRSAEVSIASPYDGLAQIVVATDRVLSVQTQPVSQDGTRLSIPVSEAWGEGAYVMVSVYRSRDAVLRAKPRRAVGVAYIPVDKSARTFELEIAAPDVARPRREQRVTVEIESGPREPVYLTVAAVDEGILQLTEYDSPDPAAHFFGKKALGVAVYDDYGRLLDPNLGYPAAVRSGGDQLGGEGLSVVPTKTVALFSGLVDIGRSRTAQVSFDLPDFNGELRIMAVAWSETGVGAAAKAMTVRDEAPAELILPRFMAPGDEAVATLTLDNVEGAGGTYSAAMDASAPLAIEDGALVEQALQRGQRTDAPVELTASGIGVAEIDLLVSGPAGFEVERSYQIETRSPYLPVSRVETVRMQPGDRFDVSDDLLAELAPGSVETTVSFSTLPVDGQALYASLSRYPYGCTEQMVSRALPLLYSEQLLEPGQELAAGVAARQRVQEAVSVILSRQSADGAIGLWREGDRNASPWLGAYAVDFLARAKENGYAVPQEALDRAYDNLREIGQGEAWRVYGYDVDVWESRWHADTQQKLMGRAAPYALYVLAKSGEASVSRLRYLHDREIDKLDGPLAKAQLAAALAHMGDRARAASAFDDAVESLGYENNGDYYQTPLRDLSGVLALAAETEFNDQVDALAERLRQDARDPSRLTTQEKAFTLLAVDALGGGREIVVDVEGLGRGNDNDARYILGESDIASGASFTLGGETPVFRTVLTRGAPTEAPPAASSFLSASKSFFTLGGAPARLRGLTQGDQLVAVITVSPQENRVNPVIIADLLPAGFEIETVLRPGDTAEEGVFSWVGETDAPETAEARDDRFVAAIDVRDSPVKLAYLVRAVTPGDFALPGVTAEDMYRPDVFARSPAARVAIAPRASEAGGSP